MYIIASSIISTYDVDKKQNVILKIPWFQTPASHFSRNWHENTGELFEQKVMIVNSFRVFGGSSSAHPLPAILSKHNNKEADIKGRMLGLFYIPKGEGSGGS